MRKLISPTFSRQSGFTIPELLVALLVFSLVIGGAANLLVSGIAGQRSSLAMQELLDQASFASEYMSRHLRQAQKDLEGTCLSSAGLNYEGTQAGEGVKFVNVQGQCHEFFLEAGRIKEQVGLTEQFLTTDNLTVTSLQFILQGQSQADNLQPKVTFAFEVEGQGKPESRPKLQFQSTVSQRNVDVLASSPDGGVPLPPPPPPPPSPDTAQPATVIDLAASNPTASSVDLSWTATGDDGTTGTASSYDIRYATSKITEATWVGATQALNEPPPQPSGSAETFTVSGLSAETAYYFAMKVYDEVQNESELSNVPSATTSAPSPPPAEPSCGTTATGSQTYFVSTPNQPQILQVTLDPVDVQAGGTQTVIVKARDTNDNPITDVSGTATIDSGPVSFSLSLVAGTTLNGTWEGFWSPPAPICTTYEVEITATSASGQSSVVISPLQ